MKKIQQLLLALTVLATGVLFAQSPQEQADRQCRSIHLTYEGWSLPAEIMTTDTIVRSVYPGTYFCVLAFNGGYAGIQELGNGEHVAIFSVWDPGDPFNFAAHPGEVAEHMRTKVYYSGEGVNVSRFGGEGTGGKSMMKFDWKIGQNVRFAVSMTPDGDYRTAYTCWIWKEAEQTWFRMATFSTIVEGNKGRLNVCYCFVEDFLRNVESKKHARRAEFSTPWAYRKGKWTPATQAVFSGDSNLLMTIDAGLENGRYWLQTGADTKNVTVPLWGKVKVPVTNAAETKDLREKLVELVSKTQVIPAAQPCATTTK